ncbi:liprin-beta-2-like [Notothenia coriiceps]|uniref:Liprin-beta-2-like n=1 Tax=Notothenia coriiceps TaxID=8208 RepID=A0A6I9P3A4_9TELE|nr:PREDICTED: liprin-beta-2-like [Notothenia coriiceps]
MCRFQEEISTRIQEKRALEEREAQQGQPRGSDPPGHSLGAGSVSSDLSLAASDPLRPDGGQNVHDLLQEVKQLKREVEDLQGEKGQYERKIKATKSLMSQLSSLQLKVEHMQLEKQQWEESCHSAQADISELQQLLASKDAEIECLETQLMARGGTADENTERDQEYQRLKVGMESLLASNDEKERRIEELTILLGQYRKMREVMALTQGSSDEDLSGSSGVRAFTHKAHSDIVRSQMSSLSSSPFVLSSSPYQRGFDSSWKPMDLTMLESRFNPETLAMLLNIPPEKTLLRRHLTTNFNNLVGAEAHLEKKVYTEATGNTPLSITAKVKNNPP